MLGFLVMGAANKAAVCTKWYKEAVCQTYYKFPIFKNRLKFKNKEEKDGKFSDG